MNSENEIELAIGTQSSKGNTEPVLDQQMQVDSPPRTMESMQGRMQQTAYVGGIPFLTASGNISQYGWTGGVC